MMEIEIDRISKTFRGIKALDRVSLQVQPGELVALLGPSGCGKTTLLRVIAGLETPDADSGAVRIQREDMSFRSARERKVGFVFQHYALFRHLTVFENIAFGLRVRPRENRPEQPEIARRVGELLNLIQMEAQADLYPAQLSGGQRQRVALARALAPEPRLILLDEPFGALDARVRQELRHWLRRLHEKIKLTSVFVTHDQEEALELADRVVVMDRGRIEQVGTPNEVFHQPASEFVMRFLGEVNIFHCRRQDWPESWSQDGKAAPDGMQEPEALLPVYVRPYEIEIETAPSRSASIPAKVMHFRTAGPRVWVELACGPERITVEVSHRRFQELAIAEGSEVFLAPRRFTTFPPGSGPVPGSE